MSDIFLSKRVLKKKLAYVFSAWGVMPPVRKSINEAIEKSVATDVVSVVRCKDCDFWNARQEHYDPRAEIALRMAFGDFGEDKA